MMRESSSVFSAHCSVISARVKNFLPARRERRQTQGHSVHSTTAADYYASFKNYENCQRFVRLLLLLLLLVKKK
jgi:hypothetical protein